WLLAVARRADPNPWRDRARDPDLWGAPEALVRLVQEAPAEQWSPEFLAALGIQLERRGGPSAALLRMAQQLHPDDFWLNLELGHALGKTKPAQAEGYYRAALALRPGTPAVLSMLGTALAEEGRLEEAVEEFQRALALDPAFAGA